MTGKAGGHHIRVKTAKGRKTGSTRWLERQLNDPYVKRARAEGYRSRAAYKLLELDERFGFLKGVERVVDLGIAPGGWTQVVRQKAPDALRAALGGPADLVLSDMAANTVGHPQTDHLRTMGLVADLKRRFSTVKHAKPPASRKGSSEWYVVAQGFKG